MNEKDVIQEYINSRAKDYYYARINANKAQMDSNRNAIMVKLYEPNRISKKMINNNLEYSKKNNMYYGYEKEDALSDAVDFFCKEINKYDYEKNPNFTAWLLKSQKFDLNNKLSKMSTTKDTEDGEKSRPLAIRNKNTISDSEGNEVSVFDTMADDTDFLSEVESKDILSERRAKIISVITLFYKRNKGKSANDTKYSYYRIFTTETVTKDIRDNNTTKIYEFENKNEIMQAIDTDYIRFIAFTDIEKMEDIIGMKIKKYKDIIPGGEDKIIALNKEPRVIIPYRVHAGLDKKAVSTSNVSQYKNAYEQEVEKIFKEIGDVC